MFATEATGQISGHWEMQGNSPFTIDVATPPAGPLEFGGAVISSNGNPIPGETTGLVGAGGLFRGTNRRGNSSSWVAGEDGKLTITILDGPNRGRQTVWCRSEDDDGDEDEGNR